MPKLAETQLALAEHGLTEANANPGTDDEVLGSVPAGVDINPSAKTLGDQYARFDRCMAEHIGIHNSEHQLALLITYNRRARDALQTVETASMACKGLQIARGPEYNQSLKANP